MGALMDPLAYTDQALGEIPGCIEVKLVDFADAGYFAGNNPPQGEIWIRGGGVTEGYLDLEEETKENFTADGWFKTGDIGEFDAKGQLRIIDRKKNLVKTLAGEYIALEKVRLSSDPARRLHSHSRPIARVHLPLRPRRRQHLHLCRSGQAQAHCHHRPRRARPQEDRRRAWSGGRASGGAGPRPQDQRLCPEAASRCWPQGWSRLV